MTKIKGEDFRKLHEGACGEWQKKLEDWFALDIAIYGWANVSNSNLSNMRSASDSAQRKILDDMFGCQYEIGDWVTKIDTPFSDDTYTKKIYNIQNDGWLQFEGELMPDNTLNAFNPRKEYLRLATNDEIDSMKSKFKIGDWVTWTGAHPTTAQIMDTCKYESDCWNLLGIGKTGNYDLCNEKHLKFATKNEIKVAKENSWKEGEPYLVSFRDEGWKLAYSTDTFEHFYYESKKSGGSSYYSIYQKLSLNIDYPVKDF